MVTTMTSNGRRNEMQIGPKPKFSVPEAPVEGDAVALVIRAAVDAEGVKAGDVLGVSCALLGGGRDYADVDEARRRNRELAQAGMIDVEVAGPYSTISALVAEYPNASLDSTARRLLAAERARETHRADVDAWLAKLEAAGLEPCERCGGAGGWKGWPGFTCYACGGSGSQAAPVVEAPAEPSLAELLVADLERQRAEVVAALDAIAAARKANADESATFAAWLKFERDANGKRLVHGNSVKAAERRNDRAADAAYEAVTRAGKRDERIASAWGSDPTTDAVVEALEAVRADLDGKLAGVAERRVEFAVAEGGADVVDAGALLLERVRIAAAQRAQADREYVGAIREARENGASLRAVGEAAGVSHVAILKMLEREGARS